MCADTLLTVFQTGYFILNAKRRWIL